MITIELPWPDKDLNPNRHIHWRKKIGATTSAYDAGYLLAQIARTNERIAPEDKFRVRYTFHPPDRRRRDQDNALSSMKFYTDGIFDYYADVADDTEVDDSQIKQTEATWGEVVKGGKVVLQLEALNGN